jgi:hypothetical protein
MNKLLILLTLLSLSVNADPVEDVWDWANDNPIDTAAIVVGALNNLHPRQVEKEYKI